MKFAAYRWPDDPDPANFPTWFNVALAARTVRISDDLAHVHVGAFGSELTAHPGDWIVRDAHGFFHVVSDETFCALVDADPKHNDAEHADPKHADADPYADPNVYPYADPHNAQVEGADAAGPPYTSAVLARSASAREKQAQYEAASRVAKSNS